jgi:hypothetical protein
VFAPRRRAAIFPRARRLFNPASRLHARRTVLDRITKTPIGRGATVGERKLVRLDLLKDGGIFAARQIRSAHRIEQALKDERARLIIRMRGGASSAGGGPRVMRVRCYTKNHEVLRQTKSFAPTKDQHSRHFTPARTAALEAFRIDSWNFETITRHWV